MSATGLPTGATATFNPPTVTPGSAGAPTVMTIQLLVVTPASVPAAPQKQNTFPPVQRGGGSLLRFLFLSASLARDCQAGSDFRQHFPRCHAPLRVQRRIRKQARNDPRELRGDRHGHQRQLASLNNRHHHRAVSCASADFKRSGEENCPCGKINSQSHYCSLSAGCFAFAPRSAAQSAPAFELGGNYTYVRANAGPGECGCINLQGGGGWGSYNLTSSLGIVGEVAAQHASNIGPLAADLTLTSFLGRRPLQTETGANIRPICPSFIGRGTRQRGHGSRHTGHSRLCECVRADRRRRIGHPRVRTFCRSCHPGRLLLHALHQWRERSPEQSASRRRRGFASVR